MKWKRSKKTQHEIKQRNDDDPETINYKRVNNQQKFGTENTKKGSSINGNGKDSEPPIKAYSNFTSSQSKTGSNKIEDLMHLECKNQANSMEKLFRPYQCYK